MSLRTISIIFAILLIPLIFFSSLYFNDYVANSSLFNEIGLKSFDSVYKSLTLALSVVAIFLLFINYTLQQKEFTKITESSNTANDLQVVLFEKQIFVSEYEKLKEDFSKKGFVLSGVCKSLTDSLIYLESIIIESDNQKEINIATNTCFIDKEGFKELLLKHIKNLNKKITLLNNELNNKSTLNIFTTAIPSELLALLSIIYSPIIKYQLLNHDYIDGNSKNERLFLSLKEVIRDSENLQKIVQNYSISLEKKS